MPCTRRESFPKRSGFWSPSADPRQFSLVSGVGGIAGSEGAECGGEDGRSCFSVDTPEALEEGLRRYGLPRMSDAAGCVPPTSRFLGFSRLLIAGEAEGPDAGEIGELRRHSAPMRSDTWAASTS